MAADTNSKHPIVWIVSTGTEILQGHYPDLNAQWLSRQMLEMGFAVQRHLALGDDAGELLQGLGEASAQADLVLTTGGLGPTGDDLNRQVLAEIWGVELRENAEALERIRERFLLRGQEMPGSNRVQALIPLGAAVFQNDHGTAPGFCLPPVKGRTRAMLMAMPGPPREMRPMFLEQAAPLVLERFCGAGRCLRTLSFHLCGVSESRINEAVKDLFGQDPEVNFALLAKPGLVDVRLTLMGRDEAHNRQLEALWRERIHERLGRDNIFCEDGETLEQALGRLMREKGYTLCTAESCTGGLIAGGLTDVAGASDFLREGFVTYANEAKMKRLGVPEAMINAYGSVSSQVAEAMALGAWRESHADWAISVTGIAGPAGGSDAKPVGLVYFGRIGPKGLIRSRCCRFLGDRAAIRHQAVSTALDFLRRGLIGAPDEPCLPPIEHQD